MPAWWERALRRGYWSSRGFETDYPHANGFIPAAANNFTVMDRTADDIDQIVIHITGGTHVGRAINTFAAPNNPDRTSAHYIVSRDCSIYQMVREKDKAHHAGPANGGSIGIEHVATNRSGPSEEQYMVSAALVRYLASKYNVPVDRDHIRGHQEVITTGHNCPGPLWDWAGYMRKVHGANVAPRDYCI